MGGAVPRRPKAAQCLEQALPPVEFPDRCPNELSGGQEQRVCITHDTAVIEAIADHVVVMQGGRVLEHGAKTDIVAPSQADYTHLPITSTPEDTDNDTEI